MAAIGKADNERAENTPFIDLRAQITFFIPGPRLLEAFPFFAAQLEP
jgi:hypothetical protein